MDGYRMSPRLSRRHGVDALHGDTILVVHLINYARLPAQDEVWRHELDLLLYATTAHVPIVDFVGRKYREVSYTARRTILHGIMPDQARSQDPCGFSWAEQ